MKMPNYLVSVTPLSKILAAILFITLPFIGFYLGMQYQKKITPINNPLISTIPSSIPTLTQSNTFKYQGTHYSFEFPKDWYIAQETIDSVLLEKQESYEGNTVHPRQTVKANISITMKELRKPTTLNDWFNENYFNSDKIIFDLTKKSIKEELLDNISAFSIQVPGAAGYLDEGIVSIKENKGYSIRVSGIAVSGYENAYTTVVKSFRFVDLYTRMCGGIAGIQCPSGYTCVIQQSYPDAAGTCIKE
jgi:hypothetical protein